MSTKYQLEKIIPQLPFLKCDELLPLFKDEKTAEEIAELAISPEIKICLLIHILISEFGINNLVNIAGWCTLRTFYYMEDNNVTFATYSANNAKLVKFSALWDFDYNYDHDKIIALDEISQMTKNADINASIAKRNEDKYGRSIDETKQRQAYECERQIFIDYVVSTIKDLEK